MGSPSHFLEKKRVLGFEKALPKRAPPLGGGAPPSPSRFCQLSAIKADYWPTLAPRPAPRAARRESVPPSVRPAQGTGDVSPSPRMLSDFQSEPIRAIGGRLKIGGHPAPPIGEFADRGEWPTTEGADLRREVPSEGLLLRLFVWGRNSPAGGGFPIRGPPPHPPPSATAADGNGNWGRTTRGEFLPESFSAVFRPCSQLIGVSADELLGNRVEGTRFSNPPLPALAAFASIGALSSLRSLHWSEGSPLRPSPPFFAHLRGGPSPFPPIGEWGENRLPHPSIGPGAD